MSKKNVTDEEVKLVMAATQSINERFEKEGFSPERAAITRLMGLTKALMEAYHWAKIEQEETDLREGTPILLAESYRAAVICTSEIGKLFGFSEEAMNDIALWINNDFATSTARTGQLVEQIMKMEDKLPN